MPKLALFDLDNTLLADDSDHAWGQYMVSQQLVDQGDYLSKNQAFYEDYEAGTLDIDHYLRFVLGAIAQIPQPTREQAMQDFVKTVVEPMIAPKTPTLLAQHRQNGDTLVIITATNNVIAEPIAQLLGIEHCIASQAEVINGELTGEPTGTPCFQAGKIDNIKSWPANHPSHDLSQAVFYSDSANDIPLLSQVARPVAVDADARLKAHAKAQDWEIMSLRN